MKQLLTRIKPFFRWFIVGGVLFFLFKTFKDRFAEVAAVSIDTQGWLLLICALTLTIGAHIWSGYVWTKIVQVFQQPLGIFEGIRVYLLTNIAKYSPGNIWHFYGRVSAIARRGGSRGAATLCVLLEPLLMAAAALMLALICQGLSWQSSHNGSLWLQIASLIMVLGGIHPRILNKLLHRLSRSKNKDDAIAAQAIKLEQYPLIPFLGEVGFVIIRGLGFCLTFLALQSLTWQQIPQLFRAFSFAWLLGLVIPGAPGGLGVFEVTAYSLLDNAQFPSEISAVALYRLVSILAEAIAAAVSWKIKMPQP